MNNINTRRWLSLFKRYGHDSCTLCAALYKGRAAMVPVLNQEAAENSNTVAQSLLVLYKQVNLMRYQGPYSYFSNRIKRRTSSLKLKYADIDDRSAGTNHRDVREDISRQKKAKIAFMITKTQRLSLIQELGFPDEVIRTFTPTQASLILERQLRYDEECKYEENIKILVKENDELMRLEAEETRREHDRNEITEKTRAEVKSYSVDEQNAVSPNLATAAPDIHESISADTWFEVVQRRGENNDDMTVIGLYKTEKEAEECKGLKQDLASKRTNNDTSYFVRIKE